MTGLASDLIGSTPARHTRAVTLALLHFMRDLGALRSTSHWSVACSGGPDSLALTFAAADLGHRNGIDVQAVIVDHQMRPESSTEATRTSALLSEWSIPNQVIPVTVSNEGGLEAAAREARYQVLRQVTPAGGLILLGHTMDDQAETVLLGLGRGSGARSLSGMRPVVEDPETGHRFVRPLLTIRRFDTEGMCKELALNPIEDPSNAIEGGWTTADGRPLPRVAVRHRVIPQLSEALGRDIVPLLARTADLLDRDATALEQIASQVEKPADSCVLDVKKLAELPPAIRTRVLIDAAINQGTGPLEASHVDALEKLVTDYRGGGPIHLPNGVRAYRQKTDVHGTTKRVIKILKTD